MNWKPIDTAPKDGRPVWVRGHNWGDPEKGQYRCWAYWIGGAWLEATASGTPSTLLYLVEWLPESPMVLQ